MVLKNIPTHPREGYFKFQGEGDLKSQHWNFQRYGTFKPKPFIGGLWYFLEQHDLH